MNIEGLRPGGAPSPSPARAPWEPEEFTWPEDGEEGPRRDDPVKAQLAEGLFLHRSADVRECYCGLSYISAAHLKAHQQRDHSRDE